MVFIVNGLKYFPVIIPLSEHDVFSRPDD